MIPIQKGTEPEGLKKLREKMAARGLSPKDSFKKLKGTLKENVRQCLIEEQGSLCAYCMCRIPRSVTPSGTEAVIIEHFIPRNPDDGRDVGQGLDYNNLLAVCNGNRAPKGLREFRDLTCDAHRENTEFKKINPCKPETLTSIFYKLDGKIDALDPDVKFDLEHTLNLNCPSAPLIAERKAALDTLIGEIGQVDDSQILNYCTQILEIFQGETNPKTPYAGVLIWYLQTTVERLQTT